MGLPKTFKNAVVFLANTLEENKVRSLLRKSHNGEISRGNGCYNSNLDCNQTLNQFGVEELVLGLEEFEILTHSEQQQPQVPNAHKKKSLVRCPPKGLSFTGSWSQLRSSARHILSNRQAQLKQLRLVNLPEKDTKAHIQAPSQGFQSFLLWFL